MNPAPGRGSIVEGEFVFTADDFRQIAQMLHAHAGIALNEGKAALVYSRLAKRLRTLGLTSFRDYCALVEGADGVDERQKMTAALTTNVTRFYREPHHFDDLRDRVMPDLAARARAGGRVRLWSAACSNGQEPYSMALTVLSVLPEAADLDVRILATDANKPTVAVTSPAAMIAISAMHHSGRFSETSATRSPGLSPSARRLCASRQT
jgi:chemotaxis protein methyltransferase CheR